MWSINNWIIIIKPINNKSFQAVNKLDWQGFNIFKIKQIRTLNQMDKLKQINYFL
jgi:hypothetical protein